MGTEIPTIDIARAQATLGRDDQGRPTVVISDGTTEVVLAGGDSHKGNLVGASRIAGAVWDYQQTTATACLSERRPAEDPYSPESEARIAELRGHRPSVSGAY